MEEEECHAPGTRAIKTLLIVFLEYFIWSHLTPHKHRTEFVGKLQDNLQARNHNVFADHREAMMRSVLRPKYDC